jgi:hypothetical protein
MRTRHFDRGSSLSRKFVPDTALLRSDDRTERSRPRELAHISDPRDWKMRVPFVERCLFQEQQNVMLDPLLQVPNREQDAFRFHSGSVPLLAEAIGECLFLRLFDLGNSRG